MKLRDVLRDVPVRTTNGADLDAEITAVVSDSRLARRGSLFVAVPGIKLDGAKFIDGARAKGAVAIVAESPGFIEVADARAALALIAANFYGRPADKLSIVGVTGTSGKTTTTKMIESIFDALPKETAGPVGLIGTIEYRAGDERLNADRTTPDAVMLQEWFAKMVDADVKHAVMEVSSHALALKRTFGIRFAAAVFTNLSQDHFDFHKDFEDYFQAKRILFTQTRKAIANIDDAYGRRIAEEFHAVTFGRESGDIRPKDVTVDVRGLHGTIVTPRGDLRIDSQLLGTPNLYNWLAAIGAAQAVDIDNATIERGIAALGAVRGRFETVSAPDGAPTVIVDYAHKPDALEKLLHAVRDLDKNKRLVVLFGCGGDRDKDKRPKMAAIAGRLADYTILTSDNPRSEKPEAILDDIEHGMPAGAAYARIADRRAAIKRAIGEGTANDVVVIAGKGHESYQVVGDQVIHFDDREEAEIALKNRRL